MAVSCDGYVAYQDKHRIIVSMPQTARSVRSTALPLSDRQEEMDDVGLMCVLELVRLLMEREDERDSIRV